MSAPKLTEAQRRALEDIAECGQPKGARGGASVAPLHRLGMIVPREPRGTGWGLTEPGRAALGGAT